MKYPIFAMKDRKVGFMTPMVDQNVPSAVRNFKFAVGRQDSIMKVQPDDFSLYQIGEYETDTGVIKPMDPQFIVDAISIMEV